MSCCPPKHGTPTFQSVTTADAAVVATSPPPSVGCLTAPADLVRYPQQQLRSLELLLPVSLWSDTFLEARARFTLAASSPQWKDGSAASPAPLPPPQGKGPTAREDRAHLTPCAAQSSKCVRPAPSSSSFMNIRRSSCCKRGAHDTIEHKKDDAAAEEDGRRVKVQKADVPETPNSTAELLSCCDYDEKRRGGGVYGFPSLKLECDESSLPGLSASSCEDCCPTWDGVSTTTTLSNSTAGSRQSSSDGARSNAGPAEGPVDIPPPLPCPSLTPPHRDAIALFERVLQRVAAVHNTQCPLCSPLQAPPWGEFTPLTIADRHASFIAATESPQRGRDTGTAEHQSNDGDDTDTALVARRARLRGCAIQLLQRQEARLRHLRDTKPPAFRGKVSSHPLAQGCAQLGGLPLLRVLVATL